MPDPAAALNTVKQTIADAAKAVARTPGDVTLIAVSKTHGPDRIQPVIDAGQRVFGENRVQEAQGKWPGLKELAPDIELHLIGPLQSNKTKDAVALFDVLHTLDRPKLAARLADEFAVQGRVRKLFIQVNTGEEPQKAGIAPGAVDDFVAQCRGEFDLAIEGLMCIPPAAEAPAPHFALLRKLAERNGLAGLSMGMSADFETAVRLGASHVRVGSAIFGERGQT